MVCEKCGLPLIGTEAFCPQCGAEVNPEPDWLEPEPVELGPEDAEAEPPVIEAADVPLLAPRGEEPVELGPVEAAREAPPAARVARPKATAGLQGGRLVGPLGLGLLSGCLVFVVLGLALLGVVQGLRIRNYNQSQVAARHYAQGVAHMQQGEYELAAAEFEWALRLRPNYPEAQEKLIEAQSKVSGQPSPTPEGGQAQPSTLLAEGRSAYDRGQWDTAIQKLEALQELDPNYEQSTVRRLLVGAYTNSGLKLVNEDRLEEAIRRFDQALVLQPDDPDVQNQRRLAALYQSALSAWDVDWNQAIRGFSTLYTIKPDYKDTAQRLQRAYVHAGDTAGEESKWCEAVDYYKAALNLASTPEIAAKRDDATHRCSSPEEGGTPAPSGTFVGSFSGQEDIRYRTTNWTKVQGRVVNAKGEGVAGAHVRLSAYDWSSVHYTDGEGYYGFENLQQEATFTVTLVDLPAQPVDVPTKFGYASIANFQEEP